VPIPHRVIIRLAVAEIAFHTPVLRELAIRETDDMFLICTNGATSRGDPKQFFLVSPL
jgi:hypothetical protein